MTPSKAFTLIELLIVVAIIAILAAIAVPNFLEAQTRAKVSRAKADLRSLALAAESYYVDYNNYPYTESNNTSIWMPAGGRPRHPALAGVECGGLTSPIAYITAIPDDVFKHPIDDSGSGFVTAPIYMEKAGFGFKDGVKLSAKPSNVPADAVATRSLTGIGADTQVTNMNETPRRWIMYSLGPDLTPHVTDRASPSATVISRSRWNINNRYDPTNGTISTGNIYRLDDGTNVP